MQCRQKSILSTMRNQQQDECRRRSLLYRTIERITGWLRMHAVYIAVYWSHTAHTQTQQQSFTDRQKPSCFMDNSFSLKSTQQYVYFRLLIGVRLSNMVHKCCTCTRPTVLMDPWQPKINSEYELVSPPFSLYKTCKFWIFASSARLNFGII